MPADWCHWRRIMKRLFLVAFWLVVLVAVWKMIVR